MSNIVSLYIDKYDIRDDESEEKRVRGIVNKIHEKGSVFCDFPFDYMMEDEQLVLLHHMMTSLPERQIMANMKKIDVDRYYMNFVYQSENSKEKTKSISENELEGYSPISLADEYLISRDIIRNPINDINGVLKYLLEINETVIRLYLQEKMQLKVMGLKTLNYEYIKEYIDYVANVLLQLLVYRVINKDSVKSLNVINVLSEKIDEIDELIEKQLGRSKKGWLKAREDSQSCLSAETVSKCFTAYVTHRSRFYEEFSIKEVLKEEMLNSPSLFREVPTEYKAKKIIVPADEIKTVKSIITEGQHIDGYKDKLETVRTFIDIMADYGGRQCHSLCLQDLKVYYREIFVSKSSYRRRRASRIVKEYIDQVALAKKERQSIPEFNKQSQYMFVREKINRGYFREKELSKEYIGKIVFEKKLYDLLLKLYLFYDIQDSLEFIYEVNYNLLNLYNSQLEG
ncbi:hypothetical protein HMPREF9474_02034 [ [[Clostridium] symbiosum WAL-14163]|uniref:Uncharacterized protein n=1 Tax=Clostridium symbiosum (strain WAL-14163) TaxID=742740 RepID=E7GM89_CLOS6|nr:hypothetical protein [[Clostridium] symbiosum]EGA94015.1 hypothetical protein HMPREF9474_02034 [ [[Clostridium] symbiosum WAL-14163]MDB2024139.1 hypothetical protein [[Clostridium] symbiosum]SCI53851.1 Uncharacterised protein [uncultured Clostridium sp.]